MLILDELNRVDVSRLLGDAFSTLEDRSVADDLPMIAEDGSRRTLRLPNDLYICATLNLIDQSVEQLDFALRRRFPVAGERFPSRGHRPGRQEALGAT